MPTIFVQLVSLLPIADIAITTVAIVVAVQVVLGMVGMEVAPAAADTVDNLDTVVVVPWLDIVGSPDTLVPVPVHMGYTLAAYQEHTQAVVDIQA